MSVRKLSFNPSNGSAYSSIYIIIYLLCIPNLYSFVVFGSNMYRSIYICKCGTKSSVLPCAGTSLLKRGECGKEEQWYRWKLSN